MSGGGYQGLANGFEVGIEQQGAVKERPVTGEQERRAANLGAANPQAVAGILSGIEPEPPQGGRRLFGTGRRIPAGARHDQAVVEISRPMPNGTAPADPAQHRNSRRRQPFRIAFGPGILVPPQNDTVGIAVKQQKPLAGKPAQHRLLPGQVPGWIARWTYKCLHDIWLCDSESCSRKSKRPSPKPSSQRLSSWILTTDYWILDSEFWQICPENITSPVLYACRVGYSMG